MLNNQLTTLKNLDSFVPVTIREYWVVNGKRQRAQIKFDQCRNDIHKQYHSNYKGNPNMYVGKYTQGADGGNYKVIEILEGRFS